MARTDNTAPIRVQEEDGRQACWNAGGSYRGIGEISRRANRRDRQKVRRQLGAGHEPSIDQTRHGEKHFYW